MRKLAGVVVMSLAGLALSLLSGCVGGTMVDGHGQLCKWNEGAPAGTGFVEKTLTANDGHKRAYTVFIPYNYSAQKKFPVIMFLHGIGEAGTDGTKCVCIGLGPEIEARAGTFEFIAIFPQCANGDWNENSGAADDAMATLHQVEKDYSCDTNCVALTGLSHGGYGTWAIGAKYCTEFSALCPMCSEPDYKDVQTLTKIPGIKAWHFSNDPFVPASNTSDMCDQINKAGGHAEAIIIDAFGHACWHNAYGGDEMYQFILSTRRHSPVSSRDVKTNNPG